jgi:hypothetical protein
MKPSLKQTIQYMRSLGIIITEAQTCIGIRFPNGAEFTIGKSDNTSEVLLEMLKEQCPHNTKVYSGFGGSLWECSVCGKKG